MSVGTTARFESTTTGPGARNPEEGVHAIYRVLDIRILYLARKSAGLREQSSDDHGGSYWVEGPRDLDDPCTVR